MPCHGSDHSSPFPRRRGATADLERSLTSEPSPPYQNFRKGRDQNSRNPHGVECYESVPEIEPSEPLYDFVMKVFDHVVRSRSARKREAFAAIVATQVIEQKPWDEAEAATRLLADLSDLDVTVLTTAASAPICEAPFNGLRVVTLSAKALGGGVTVLRSVVSGAPEHLLRLACSELVARGLLHDEGSGRLSVGAMEYFVVTELGHWFLAWLSDSSRPGESLG
jgi:hypothetical protein